MVSIHFPVAGSAVRAWGEEVGYIQLLVVISIGAGEEDGLGKGFKISLLMVRWTFIQYGVLGMLVGGRI